MGSSPAPPRDFSQPVVFSVDEKRPNKTVDIGRDGTSVSAETFGTVSHAANRREWNDAKQDQHAN
jgi:hypothetical protein